MGIESTVFYSRHDDDEFYDRIEIAVIPRYKMSGLSGDEWRVSAWIRVYRKGTLIAERGWSKLEYAVAALPGWLLTLSDAGLGGDVFDHKADNMKCHQPGCPEQGTIEYRLKGQYCQVAPHDGPHKPIFDYRRRFCQRHAERGDCGFEDSDANYEQLSGPQAVPHESDVSPSRRVDVHVDSIEDLPGAIEDVRKNLEQERV